MTLVEVLVVMTIIAILAGIVVPSMVSADASSAKAGAILLASNLEYARSVAITHQTQVNITFDTAGDSFTVSSANASNVLIDPIRKERTNAYVIACPSQSGLSRLEVQAASFSTVASMAFSMSGEPVEYDSNDPNDPGAEVGTSGYVRIGIGSDLVYQVAVAAVTGKLTITRYSSP